MQKSFLPLSRDPGPLPSGVRHQSKNLLLPKSSSTITTTESSSCNGSMFSSIKSSSSSSPSVEGHVTLASSSEAASLNRRSQRPFIPSAKAKISNLCSSTLMAGLRSKEVKARKAHTTTISTASPLVPSREDPLKATLSGLAASTTVTAVTAATAETSSETINACPTNGQTALTSGGEQRITRSSSTTGPGEE